MEREGRMKRCRRKEGGGREDRMKRGRRKEGGGRRKKDEKGSEVGRNRSRRTRGGRIEDGLWWTGREDEVMKERFKKVMGVRKKGGKLERVKGGEGGIEGKS